MVGRLPAFWLGWRCHPTACRKESRFKGGGDSGVGYPELSGTLLKTYLTEEGEGPQMVLWRHGAPGAGDTEEGERAWRRARSTWRCPGSKVVLNFKEKKANSFKCGRKIQPGKDGKCSSWRKWGAPRT